MKACFRLCVMLVVLGGTLAFGQSYDTLRVATYNLLNYPGSNSAVRNPEFRKILAALNPDVLIVQEMQSSAGVSQFLNQVLNFSTPGLYSNAAFQDGPDTDNALYYKSSRVTFLSQVVVSTALRDINGYVLRPAGVTADSLDFRIYSTHLKASQGFEAEREVEASLLRDHLNALGPGHYIIGGDMNLYTSTEGAYQQFIGSQADNDGRTYDVLGRPGDWHNTSSFADIHTQSPRLTDIGDGGATGGLDDRFDFLLPTYAFQTFPSWQYVPGSYAELGNDGAHFGQSVNNGTNFAVPDSIADALHTCSDHLPVTMSMYRQLSASATVQLLTPNGGQNYGEGDSVSVTWSTANYVGTVTLALSRTGLSGSYANLVSGTANDGQYWWIATTPSTSQARIKVTLDGAPTVSDASNADFAIADRDISIFTPVADDSFAVGTSVDIQWTATNVSGNVRVELSRSPSSPAWEVLSASTPNTGYFGWISTAPLTDSARVRVLMASAPTVGDTSGRFRIKSSSSNTAPVITHNPVCDAVPGNVTFFCKVTDTGAYNAPKLYYTSNGFVTKDSVALTSVGTNRYSTTVSLLSEFYQYYLRAVDAGGLAGQTDTLDLVVQAVCPTAISYDDGTAESFQWSADSGMTWALKVTPPASPFVVCGLNAAISARKPDSTHTFVTIMLLEDNGVGGMPGDTLGQFVRGVLPNQVNGSAGPVPSWGHYVFDTETSNPFVANGDFYVALRARFTAFAIDFSGGDDSRSYLWDACDLQWLAEDGVNLNTAAGKRMFRVEGYALVPPVLVIAASGTDAVLRWSRTGAPSYQVFRAATAHGPFVTPIATTSDTSWVDTGVIGTLGQAIYVVKSALP